MQKNTPVELFTYCPTDVLYIVSSAAGNRPARHAHYFLHIHSFENECSLISLYCYLLSLLDIFSAKRFYI